MICSTISYPHLVYVLLLYLCHNRLQNHKHRSRCITVSSFAVPLLMAATTLMLSHWKGIFVLESREPHTKRLRLILFPLYQWSSILKATSTVTIAFQIVPQDPEASVCVELQGTELSGFHHIRLTPYGSH